MTIVDEVRHLKFLRHPLQLQFCLRLVIVLEITLIIFDCVNDFCEIECIANDEILRDCSKATGPASEETDTTVYIRKHFFVRLAMDSFEMFLNI